MPHQCVRCSTIYDDGAEALLKGCTCGAKLFFFIKKAALTTLETEQQTPTQQLDTEAREQIEHDVFDMIGEEREDVPVVLDFESIRIKQPGQYELDIVKLFQKDPLVFKLEEGKYVIDLAQSFEKLKKQN